MLVFNVYLKPTDPLLAIKQNFINAETGLGMYWKEGAAMKDSGSLSDLRIVFFDDVENVQQLKNVKDVYERTREIAPFSLRNE